MSVAKLERAFHAAERLPVEHQNAIADAVMEAIEIDPDEEREWLALAGGTNSQSFMERVAREVEAEIAAGRVLDFDPSDT